MPYQPHPVKAPRLSGAALRAFAAIAGAPGIGGLVRAQMLEQFGIARFRGARTDAAPGTWMWTPPQAPEEPDVAALIAAPHAQAGFRFPSVGDYLDAYRTGRVDPVEVARAVLAARAKHADLRTFIAMDEADLVAQAEASHRRWQAGEPRPLEGVPVAVKDELDQTPYPTTVGTAFLGRSPAAADATVVARLRAAGALLIGKTNMHELGLGVTGINPHHGAARNPYDPTRVTGGSSSGVAAAVAAGFCPVAIGADGGGSIRIPASLCGVVGLKATFGRVSEHGAAPLCWSVAHVGPIGAYVRDVAAVYALTSGPDPLDPGTIGHPALRADLGERGPLRVGIDRAWAGSADGQVAEACRALVDALGCEVVPVELPDPDLVRLAHTVTIVGEMAAVRLAWPDAALGADVALNFLLAQGLTAADYVHAQRLRADLARRWRAVFDHVDVIASPATGCTAPPINPGAEDAGESDIVTLDRIMRFATPGNLFGLPAISVPAGYDGDGLPIGLQLMGRPFEEHVLLRLAAACEAKVERRAPKALAGILG
ncbi:MAG: amidase [Myxococcota bacterium]